MFVFLLKLPLKKKHFAPENIREILEKEYEAGLKQGEKLKAKD